MDLKTIDAQFRKHTQAESVRMMTFDFNPALFSRVKSKLPKVMVGALETAMAHRNHLSLTNTPLDEFINSMHYISHMNSQVFKGQTLKPAGYSGKMLQDSQTFFGDVNTPVSFNEYDYCIKLYPWPMTATNKAFQKFLDLEVDNEAFLYTPRFDLESLKSKKDFVKLTPTELHVKGPGNEVIKFKLVMVE